jgi:hypothetical protein
MKHNTALLEQLAAWRELTQAEQSALREHAADCPSCSERLALYERQDRLLAGLPEVTSRVTFADIRERIAVRRAPFAPQRAWAMAFMLLLFLGLSAGAVAASGDAIPGDLLYPLKLSVEATRIRIAADDGAREELDVRFAAQRRIEAQALLSLNRSAQIDIEGELSQVRGSDWTLSGIQVTVPGDIWQGDPPEVGQRIEMRVEIKAGEMRALAVRFAQRDGPPAEPGRRDPGPTTAPAEFSKPATAPAANPPGTTPSDPPAATLEKTVRTAVPQPTGTPIQIATATPAAGAVATPVAGAPATETAAAGTQPGPTRSPEADQAGPTRTPTGSQGGQQGGGGR